MKKEHDVYVVKDKKLPKHDQVVLVKKKNMSPFIAKFQSWLGKIYWFNGTLIEVELSDKRIPILNKYF
jgi:hypothetical protein